MEILIILFILVAFITLIGHGIWVFLAWFLRTVSGGQQDQTLSTLSIQTQTAEPRTCPNCGEPLSVTMKFCGVCGAQRPTLSQAAQLRDQEATLRQLERLQQSGKYQPAFDDLKSLLQA